MKALIITNKVNDRINPSLPGLFTTVKKIAGDSNYEPKADVLIIGHQLDDIAKQISNYQTVNQVITIDNPALQHIFAENIANQLANLAKNYTHILMNADSFGKNLLPRVAGILELGQISEVVAVVSPNIFKKFIYAGNVLAEIESFEDIKLLTVRSNNFEPDEVKNQIPCNIIKLDYTNPISDKVKFIAQNIENKSVDLGSAKTVVTGGISLKSKENFDNIIRPFAHKLNAAVGASRAAVEAGFAPNDCQVGQTGVTVAPDLYIAIGISGAVQHIAGMKDSKTVIAINTDSTAPIFEYADYGLIADLFDVIPQIIQKF